MALEIEEVLRELVEELYFRAASIRKLGTDEYKAIKGVQHAIENIMAKHEMKGFERPPK